MKAPAFAHFGSEKMVYDLRMGPQCLFHEGEYFVAYQANPLGERALPHLIKRDRTGSWSEPVVLGDVANYDHHFAPVIWLDAQRHIHVLFHCHIYLNQSRHLVSKSPLGIDAWNEAPCVAPSISYPRVLPLPDGRLLLYYRALGHMGFWTWQISEDGGFTWERPDIPLVDFDHRPEIPGDDWAGSYHSVALGRDGKSLHLAFVYWDERNWPHPLYKTVVGHRNRFHLYYLRADIATGELRTLCGKSMPRPVNRKEAEACKVWDTGQHLTNMPSLLVDEYDQPSFLLPVSDTSLEDVTFWFIRREGESWGRYRVAGATNTWNGSHLEAGLNGEITAFLVGAARDPVCHSSYGGGPLEEWLSTDGGKSWDRRSVISPGGGFLCNNPRPVLDADGRELKRTLLFYGWQGPDAIAPDQPFRGQSYLWQDGRWL
jgi:hypothetical protein